MRLIETSTSSLVLDPPGLAPGGQQQYAILSHTWEDEEVSFQEYQSNNSIAQQKQGFAKIQRAVRYARDQGYNYLWVDTCCIDKTSSAELSEAINSMFRWYKNASVCFAFLFDLKPDTSGGECLVATEDELRGCKWFSRGWTLQELLAPSRLEFLDSSWKNRGSKFDLRLKLRRITSIDVDILTGKASLNSIPLAKRMSWASKRKTSRVEDLAYCLLGIFDIHMPMIYGEGRNSFIRLQEEILKKTTDLSIFAWQARLDNIWQRRGLLAHSPSEFASCGDISATRDQFRFSGEIALTNKGVRIDAMLRHFDGPIYVMNLDCYRNADTVSNRIGIFLKRSTDVYERNQPQALYSWANHINVKATQIYVRADIKEDEKDAELPDDHDHSISIDFVAPDYDYIIHSLAAVPSAFWDPDQRYFFTRGLAKFLGFVTFQVNHVMSAATGQTPQWMERRQGHRFLLLCDARDEPNESTASLFTTQDLRYDETPDWYICPFENISGYGPQGDRQSFTLLALRAARDGQRASVVASDPLDGHAFSVSAALSEVPGKPHQFKVKVTVTRSGCCKSAPRGNVVPVGDLSS